MASNEMQQQMKSLSKGSDIKEDLLIVMAPHSNWEEYLMPAPISIALIGQMMVISTQQDFSLEGSKPEDGWAPIRNPKSFRACLQQVANDGYDAFKVAHKNMDAIRLSTVTVPEVMKAALEILFKGGAEDIKDYLPIELGRIKNASDTCLEKAKEVEAQFDGLMDLTGKLLEVSNAAKGDHEEKLKEAKVQKELKKLRKLHLEEKKKEQKKREEEMQKSMKRAEEEYYKARDELPNGWSMLAMNCVESMCKHVSIAGQLLTIKMLLSGAPEAAAKAVGLKQPKQINPDIAKTYVMAFELKGIMEAIMSFVDENKMAAIPKDKDDPGKALMYIKAKFDEMLKSSSSLADSKPNKKLKDTCKEATEICQSLSEMVKSFSGLSDEKKKKLAKQILDLDKGGKNLLAQANKFSNSTELEQKTPATQAQQIQTLRPKKASQQAMEQGQFNINTAKEVLKDSRDQYDKVVAEREKTADELMKVIEEMKNLDVKEIDFEKTVEVLRRGIMVFNQLREKWSKLVEFFQMTSSLIEVTLQDSLQTFIKYSETEQERSGKGYTPTGFIKDKIYQQAFQGSKICYLINVISSAYVEVSGKHLMHRIAGVGEILGFDPVTESHLIERAQRELAAGCQEAQNEIRDKIRQDRETLHIKVSKRLKALESVEIPLDPEVKDRIEKAVIEAKEEVKEFIPEPTGEVSVDIDDLY